MAPKLSNAYVQIVSRLIAAGARHRAATETLLSQKNIPLTAKQFDDLASFDNVELVGEAMLNVTTDLEDLTSTKNRYVRAAFVIAGLNYKNPFHWRVILSAFCEFNFFEQRTIVSADDGYAKIIKDVEDALRKKPSLRKNAKKKKSSTLAAHTVALAEHLKRHHDDYTGYGVTHIRKLVRHAYDPKTNLAVRYPEMSDPMLREVRALYERDGTEWTPTLEKEQSELILNTKKALDVERKKLGLPPQYEKF